MADQKALTPHVKNNDDVERLRADIETTRIELGNTINAIQERLSPARLKQEAKDSVRDATIGRVKDMAKNAGEKASGAGRGIIEVVRDNPVALAMIGLGAGWLFMNSRKRSQRLSSVSERTALGYESAYPGGHSEIRESLMDRTRESVSDAAHSVGERVSDVRQSVKEKASDVIERVTDVASDVAERTGERLGRVSDTSERQLIHARSAYDETPWVGAAVALALGAAAGLSIPHTRREDELIGDKRDALLDRARERGHEKVEAVRHVAEHVVDDVRPVAERSLREHAREEGLIDGSGASDSSSDYR
jgi:ElaB/YqjD/DUF883 family membrane-anchored ribosome-binding protein